MPLLPPAAAAAAAQERPPCGSTLLEAVQQLRPTVLIGLSDGPPPHAFTQEVCQAMAAGSEHPPLILPLSRTAPDGREAASEVGLAQALAWTQGRALVADRLTSGDVTLPSGETRHVRALDTTYIFPGGLSGRVG